MIRTGRGLKSEELNKPKKTQPNLPTREQVLAFIRDNPDHSSRREIGRAFGVRGADKIALKALLKSLERGEDETSGERQETRKRLPHTFVVEVFDVDTEEGEALAHPVDPEFGRQIGRAHV